MCRWVCRFSLGQERPPSSMILSRPPRIGALNAGVSVPRIKSTELIQSRRCCPRFAVSLFPSYRPHTEALGSSAQIRCVSPSCWRYRVASRARARVRRRALPNVEAHREEPLAPGHWELRLAAQTRIVSMAGVRLDSHKSVRSFKEILCADISECYRFQWAFALVSACV
jgi:hypothetical protein